VRRESGKGDGSAGKKGPRGGEACTFEHQQNGGGKNLSISEERRYLKEKNPREEAAESKGTEGGENSSGGRGDGAKACSHREALVTRISDRRYPEELVASQAP